MIKYGAEGRMESETETFERDVEDIMRKYPRLRWFCSSGSEQESVDLEHGLQPFLREDRDGYIADEVDSEGIVY